MLNQVIGFEHSLHAECNGENAVSAPNADRRDTVTAGLGAARGDLMKLVSDTWLGAHNPNQCWKAFLKVGMLPS